MIKIMTNIHLLVVVVRLFRGMRLPRLVGRPSLRSGPGLYSCFLALSLDHLVTFGK